MKTRAAARSAAVGVVAVALLVAGCSSSKKNSGSTPPPSTSAPSAGVSAPADNSEAPAPSAAVSGDPAAIKLYQQAIDSLSKVKSVHLKGEGSDGTDSFSIDIQFANGKGATGSIGMSGGTMKIIAVGKSIYIQADAKAFSAFAGEDIPADALQMIAGKWLKISSADAASSDNPLAGFGSDFADLKSFAQEFTPSGAVSLESGTKTIDGKTAVGILDSGDSDEDQSILYVEKDGDHLPLQIVPGPKAAAGTGSAGPSSGTINFIDYNKPVTITEPTDAIDISQLMALMGGPSAEPSS
jgi:hypothetical protein